MSVLIGHASISETGGVNGAPGDSTGREVCTRGWYDGGWKYMALHPDAAVRNRHAAAVEAACLNNNIGYGQGDRNTLNALARAVGYDLSKVGPCNCDCSSLQNVAAVASGAPGVSYGSNGWTTHDTSMLPALKAAGYLIVTDKSFLKSESFCVRGAIYVSAGHTVCGLSNGDQAGKTLALLGAGENNDTPPADKNAKGIDISNWQRGIDLAALQTDFIICKISEGADWTDPRFDGFYNTAKAPLGAYVYSHATTQEAARAEAQKALSLLNGRKLPLGVYIDVEEGAQLALSDAALTAVVKAFCDTIKAGGYRAGAYGSAGNLWRKVGPAYLGDDVLVWVASWGAEPRIGCDIWQYSDSERLPGFTGNLDGNKAMSERFAAIINGSEPAPEPPGREYRIPQAKYHAYVYQVDLNLLKIGDKGPLVQSLQLLLNGKGFPCGKDDGEFGTDTRDALLAFQSAAGILADGECGGQSWAALHNYRV